VKGSVAQNLILKLQRLIGPVCVNVKSKVLSQELRVSTFCFVQIQSVVTNSTECCHEVMEMEMETEMDNIMLKMPVSGVRS
jgi:hypothetical protein